MIKTVAYGYIEFGMVLLMVRSDWSREWPDSSLAQRKVFPGVSLAALQFLDEQRHILFHGHEPLDTDATPTLDGESWLMHHGYAQAEGVANLDKVPERLPGNNRLSQVQSRSGRLCALRCHLSSRLEVRHQRGVGTRGAAAKER